MTTYVPSSTAPNATRAIPGEIWPQDFGAIPFSNADQINELRAWGNALKNGTDGATCGFIAGRFKKTGQLDLTGGDGHPLTIRGLGSNVAGTAPSAIIDLADAGEGMYSLKNPNDCKIYDISFLAESPSISVGGTPTWEMRGVEVHAGVDLIGCAVRGYRGGGCITGDHVKIIGCDLRGNGYPIDVPPGIQTQGDIIIKETRIDGASYASIGVAQDSKLAGATISDCPAAQGPYLILRYPVAGVETYTTDDEVAANPGSVKINEWLTGVTISGLASEYLGDGAVVDGVTADEGVGVGPGISGIKWFKNSGDFGMFNTDREWKYGGSPSPYPSKIASWYIKGGIGDFEIGDGFPSGNTTQPAFQALAIHNVTANRSGGAGSLAAIKDGNLLFKTAGTVGQSILGCRLGLSGGNGSPVITAYMLATGTSSVVRGELLMRFQDAGAQKMTDTNQHCIGVVQRAASPSNIVMAVTEGTDSELMVKNSSTLECVNGGLVKPHSGGGVQPATSMLDGPPIGRVYSAAIAAGAIGPCEIFSLT